jgi:hypothetical protein
MVSKRKIAEVVLNRVNGGIINRDSKITLRQAMFAVGEVRNSLIQKDVFDNYAAFGEFDVPFDILSEYIVKSTYNTEQCKWYAELPVAVISLYNGMGIYHVSVVGDEANDLIPMKSGAISLFAGLPANELEGQRGYIPRGRVVELKGFKEEVSLLMRLIVDSDDLGDRDDFMVPADWQTQITDMAVQKMAMQAQIPQDNILDNLPEEQK